MVRVVLEYGFIVTAKLSLLLEEEDLDYVKNVV